MMNVAHKTMPFGTKITFYWKGRKACAVVNDRGPYAGGREFDLGPGTAVSLGFSGVAGEAGVPAMGWRYGCTPEPVYKIMKHCHWVVFPADNFSVKKVVRRCAKDWTGQGKKYKVIGAKHRPKPEIRIVAAH